MSQLYGPELDTWCLLEAAEKEVREGERVLEIGCGSAVISASLRDRCRVLAADINPHATAAARSRGVISVRADLLNGIRGPFDLVLFNPPYLPTREDERIDDWLEYALDGGKTGRELIERFLPEVGRVLAPRGRVLLLISSLTGELEVLSLCRAEGFSAEVIGRWALEDEELCVIRLEREGS
jgi:release factor glutamine methyltransferase